MIYYIVFKIEEDGTLKLVDKFEDVSEPQEKYGDLDDHYIIEEFSK